MWVLLGPGDTALVPSPSYPIHIYAPLFAGADVRQVRSRDPSAGRARSGSGQPRRRLLRRAHGGLGVGMAQAPGDRRCRSPTTPPPPASTWPGWSGWWTFAREHEVVLVHDFAYADIGFDGYQPPSILQVPGAKEVAVELYTLTKSFSMAGWRVGLPGRQPRDRPGPDQAEELPRLRDLPAHPDRGHRGHERGARLPGRRSAGSTRPDATRLCDGLNRIGWPVVPPKGRCSSGRPSPSPTGRWARSSSPSTW